MEMENSNFYVEELNGLRSLANGLIYPESESVTETKEIFTNQLDDLVHLIQRVIQFKQLHLDDEAIVFMDHLQSELVQLSEDCNASLHLDKKVTLATEIKAYLIILLDAINNLLDHFKEHYSYCFNFKMVVPVSYKQKVDLSLAKIWDKLLQSLKDVGLDDKLIKVFATYCQEMKSNKKTSFHLLYFWQTLANDLGKINLENVDEIELDLCKVLCYHNFNYSPLIHYSISRMQRNYDTVENYREEYIRITIDIRTLRQLIVRNDSSYDANAVSLKEALCNVLENELLCIKKLINMNKKIFEGSGTKFFLQQFYFKISISMEQFLFIFRLLIDKGIVLVKRKADLYEFIHTHVGTAKKDNLSIGNMQNTYAENNRITAIKVKVLLQSLIKLIDEKYLSVFWIPFVF